MDIHKIELTARGPVNVRETNGHAFNRVPGADISDLPADAQAAINAWWTEDRVAAWQAQAQEDE